MRAFRQAPNPNPLQDLRFVPLLRYRNHVPSKRGRPPLRHEMGTETLSAARNAGLKDPILCRLVGHRRSSMLAFTEGHGIWKSRCKRCGAAMVRSRSGQWTVTREVH